MTCLRINCYCITAAETWLATCKPYRGIFKRVCGRPSNCDSVWLLPIGSGTVTAPGKPKLRGQTSCLRLWLFSVFLILFVAPVSLSLPLSLFLVYWEKKKSSQQCSLQIRMMSFIVVWGDTQTLIFGLPRLKAHCLLDMPAVVIDLKPGVWLSQSCRQCLVHRSDHTLS